MDFRQEGPCWRNYLTIIDNLVCGSLRHSRRQSDCRTTTIGLSRSRQREFFLWCADDGHLRGLLVAAVQRALCWVGRGNLSGTRKSVCLRSAASDTIKESRDSTPSTRQIPTDAPQRDTHSFSFEPERASTPGTARTTPPCRGYLNQPRHRGAGSGLPARNAGPAPIQECHTPRACASQTSRNTVRHLVQIGAALTEFFP